MAAFAAGRYRTSINRGKNFGLVFAKLMGYNIIVGWEMVGLVKPVG